MGERRADVNHSVSDDIRAYGWHCLHVLPTVDDGTIAFTYSIGFFESYDAPEVLVFGLALEKAHALLHECAYLLESGHTIVPGVEDGNVLAGDYKVIFKPVRQDKLDEYLGTAIRYYRGRPFSAMVMFLPDRHHRFPWQPGYDDIPAEEFLAIV